MISPMIPSVLERQGCRLQYWVGGPVGTPLVVFTHGACVDHHSFDPAVPTVAQHYRVLTWDVRGHGLSQPIGAPFSLPLAVDDLLALLDQLGYSKAVLVGHSNGTYIAQELAFRHPERVQALVIADGTCITWPHTAFEYWLLNRSGDVMALVPCETLKRVGLQQMSADPAVQQYIYRAFSMCTKSSFVGIWKGLVKGLHTEPGYRITQPLLMHGADDAMGDIKKIAPQWAAREPSCEYVVIPNARHMAVLDNPAFFTQHVLAFLDTCAAFSWCIRVGRGTGAANRPQVRRAGDAAGFARDSMGRAAASKRSVARVRLLRVQERWRLRRSSPSSMEAAVYELLTSS